MNISASATNTFKSCKRKYFYSKTQPFKTKLSFKFGLAFEYGLEVYLKNRDIQKSIFLAKDNFYSNDLIGIVTAERLEKIKTKGGDIKCRLSISTAKEEAEKLIAEHDILLEDMIVRLIYFINDNDIKIDAMQLETVSKLGEDHRNTIRLDGIAEYQGKRWIFELKSYKNFKTKRELQVDNQLLNYYNVTSRKGDIFEGILFVQVKKAIPEEPKVLKKGGLSVAKNQKCDAELYISKAEQIYGEDIPIEVLECYSELLNRSELIEMLEVKFNQRQLDNHWDEMKTIADEMEIVNTLRYKDIEQFKKACYTNYGMGCAMCDHKELCYNEGSL